MWGLFDESLARKEFKLAVSVIGLGNLELERRGQMRSQATDEDLFFVPAAASASPDDDAGERR